MKPFLILAILTPCALGNCCMPQNFAARTYAVDGPMGDGYVYVDFTSKRITVIPDTASALKGLLVDFGVGTVYKHYYLLDQCSQSPFQQLSDFDRCIPDDASGNATEGYWKYQLPRGMRITVSVDTTSCHPFFFQLSDPSNPDWVREITWVGLIDDLDLNVSPPYMKTFQCSDDGDIFG